MGVAHRWRTASLARSHRPMENYVMRRTRLHVVVALIASWIGMAGIAALRADDWPGWLGPERDGIWRESGLVEKFPEGGPKIVWRAPLGIGYSGPSVAEGRVYVMDL